MNEPKRARQTPNLDDTVRLPVRLRKNTHAQLMAEADARMINASLIVEAAVVKFLGELKPVGEQLSIGE